MPILDARGRLVGGTIIGREITDRMEKEEFQRRTLEDLERRVADRTSELSRANDLLVREVAERKRLEEAARESEARYQTIVEALPDMIFRLRRDGIFLGFKPAKGVEPYRPPEEFLGKKVTEILPPDLAAIILGQIRDAIEGKDAAVIQYSLPYGKEVHRFESRVIALGRDEVIGIVRDVSERERAEEAARRHRDELAHVARLTTMGEIASGLAHELSQPLAAIATSTGASLRMLRKLPGLPAEAIEALEQVAAQAERAGGVIRGLRAFMARGEPQRTAEDLNRLVRETIGLDGAELRSRSVEVRLDLAPDLPPVPVDAPQIQQVILNLLRNAIEAMAGSPPESREISIRTARGSDGSVEVAVRDRGMGIDPEVADHLFEPFRTTKPGGMGMGLAISRRIAEAHRGRLWVQPNPDRGVTFRLALPAGPRENGATHGNGVHRLPRR